MKKKMGIILLALGFLLMMMGAVYGIFDAIKKSSKLKKEDEFERVEVSYSCKLEEQNFEGKIDGSTVKFLLNDSYNFSYNKGEILYTSKKLNYQFKDLGSYQAFQWTEKNSSIPPNDIKENQEKLTKQYTWLITFPKENDSDDLEDYLNQLSTRGYTCQELE